MMKRNMTRWAAPLKPFALAVALSVGVAHSAVEDYSQ